MFVFVYVSEEVLQVLGKVKRGHQMPLELEWVGDRKPTWVLGTKLQSCARAASSPNHRAFLPPQHKVFGEAKRQGRKEAGITPLTLGRKMSVTSGFNGYSSAGKARPEVPRA